MKNYYYSMEHRGGLKEALQTLKPMEKDLAELLIKTNFYQYYTKDERIEAERYIINNIPLNLGFPQWILVSKKPIKLF